MGYGWVVFVVAFPVGGIRSYHYSVWLCSFVVITVAILGFFSVVALGYIGE
jgi:hypothetical protein